MIYDTIAAISTPLGEGGIGIVRVSGNEAINIVEKIFRSQRGVKLHEVGSHTLSLGYIVNPENGEVVDEVLISVMRKPRSYTAEDVVEINCHGGIVPLRRTLELVLRSGARLAEPGEFTKRAFLNGRIDLAQAESVIDIIRAKTDAGLDLALNQLQGKLSEKITNLRSELLEILAFVEASIDFPEEEIEELSEGELVSRCKKVKEEISKLIREADKGKVYREGLSTVIIGRPNVGKSSLLNALLKEKRAIVTDIPGTTRDIIEEIINVGGIPLRIIDTAGIRETEDVVEKMGVERSREFFAKADLVLFVLDAYTGITKEDIEIANMLRDKKAIVLINKIDLDEGRIDPAELRKLVGDKPYLKISATEEIGLEELENKILEMVFEGEVQVGEKTLVTRLRHKEALQKAQAHIMDALKSIEEGMPADLYAIDLKAAWEALGEITGETVEEDILDRIFAEFCIGK
ncbi:tRNA uridine-5-carboxymethylaminomethyl(34) synthesis GTPase MnmE [Calderihabitans maritimus]|uniref:tRNA modification GTPase MnmE n=1 Tax=Calderihabitans maritimus TaxID=1246530 RepID=A0A1Z5HVU6_9FIRM|nr:tRNA modification GTPase TrmE [Calderihabitans maritimus]